MKPINELTLSELQEAYKKLQIYELRKENNEPIAKRLNEISKELKQISEELVPTFAIATKKDRPNYKAIVEELVNIMTNGGYVTKALLEKTYPSLKDTEIYYIMDKIKKMPNVDITMDGAKARLYMRKSL